MSSQNKDEEVTFTHEELVEITNTTLNEVIEKDSLLCDLPKDVSVEEVLNQIALEHGQSMTVYVIRGDGEELPVVVKQKDATVWDLKRAISRYMTWKMKRQRNKVKISWKHIWKTYQLQFDSVKLNKDKTLLAEVGIRNKSKVTFVKKFRDKGTLD